MNSTLFAQYLVAVTVLVVVPGPDMLFCLACGLSGGARAGFAAALGTATGEAVHVAASAGGLAAVLRTAPGALAWMRFAGALVLIALGVQALRSRGRPHEQPPPRRVYLRGLLTDLLNPKTALFSIAFLPQFVDPPAGNIAMQFAVLGAVFVAMEIAVDGTVGMQAGRLARLVQRPRALDRIAGLVMLGLGAVLALDL
jgi:threonine/homoserine/homoserine lactone efflux protein